MSATAIASDRTLDKAIRLREGGKVRELPRTRVFEVQGDHGLYRVTVPPSRTGHASECTCPAAGRCAHLLAAALTIRDENREAAEAVLA